MYGIQKTSSMCGPPLFAHDPGAEFIRTACIDLKSRKFAFGMHHAGRVKGMRLRSEISVLVVIGLSALVSPARGWLVREREGGGRGGKRARETEKERER